MADEKRCGWCGEWYAAKRRSPYCRPRCRKEHAERMARDEATRREPVAVLRQAVAELASDTGYCVASELRERMLRAGVANPDKAIAELIGRGLVCLDAWDYGQMRHGEGLYGDPRMQLVKLRVFG